MEIENKQMRIVLLANQPRFLRDMLRRALDTDPGVRLILEAQDPDKLSSLVHRVSADWLIVTLNHLEQWPGSVKRVLSQNPNLSVLGISQDGDRVLVQLAAENGARSDSEMISLSEHSLSDLLSILDGA